MKFKEFPKHWKRKIIKMELKSINAGYAEIALNEGTEAHIANLYDSVLRDYLREHEYKIVQDIYTGKPKIDYKED